METGEQIEKRLHEIFVRLYVKKDIKDDEERKYLIKECETLKEKNKIFAKQRLIEDFKKMEPFNGDINKIPRLPVWEKEEYDTIVVPNLIRCGAIPKKDLIVGKTYLGDCRNASEAVWKGDVFTYKRTKFAWTYDEDINHFEDDNGYDLFVPIKLKE